MQRIRLFSQAAGAGQPRGTRLVHTAASLLLVLGVVGMSLATTTVPTAAQTTNQSYDCGTYGAGTYGSNDCLVTAATPPPTRSAATPTPGSSTVGGLPVTGAQLLWSSVIGLALIVLGIGLRFRRKRMNTSGGQS